MVPRLSLLATATLAVAALARAGEEFARSLAAGKAVAKQPNGACQARKRQASAATANSAKGVHVRANLPMVATALALCGAAGAQAQDIYDDPALGSVGPMLRQTDKLMGQIQQEAIQFLNPYQRRQYEDCMAQQGGTSSGCLASAQAALDPDADPYDNPALGGLGPMLRQTDKLLSSTHSMLVQQMTLQERAEYQQCMAQGIGESNCMFMAQQQEQGRQFDRERRQVDELSQACSGTKDGQACAELDRLQKAMAARTGGMEVETDALTFSQHVGNSIAQQQQRIRDRETASQYRMNGWEYGERAKEARSSGDDDLADQLQRRSDEEYDKAKEWEPPSPYSGH